MKVLTGATYTEPRLYGIIAEMFYAKVGRLPKQNDVTTMLTGRVINNSLNNNVGYIIDETSEYFNLLSEVHINRLADIVDGDGWMDSEDEEV